MNISVSELRSRITQGVNSGSEFLFAVDFECSEAIFLDFPSAISGDLGSSGVLWRVGEWSNFEPVSGGAVHPPLEPCAESFSDYRRRFDTVRSGLVRGDSFLTNLTLRTPLLGAVDMEHIARRSTSPYLLYVPGRFVCFSPEPFVSVDRGGVISTFPMKGTVVVTDGDFAGAEARLLGDLKEQREHHTIVDLMRSDLSRVASGVSVERFRYVERLRTTTADILQTSSHVCGTLLPGYRSDYGSMLMELLPAGSVSGAPKPPTLDLIAEAEGVARGFYCGVFGYFDGFELRSAVMIRYVELGDDGCYYFRSGGGLTVGSDAVGEYRELLSKIYVTG